MSLIRVRTLGSSSEYLDDNADIRNVLKYGLLATGNFSALCTVAQIPVRLICGVLSDRVTFVARQSLAFFLLADRARRLQVHQRRLSLIHL